MVLTTALDIIDKYDVFNKAVQSLKNEDPSVKKPMVVELPEDEVDNNRETERGDELMNKLVGMVENGGEKCKS